MAASHVPIEELDLFTKFVEVADEIWAAVVNWTPFARDTVGKQLVRAVDSVGANLVEGDGRHGDADALHFLVIARSSARETRYWIGRATKRKLFEQLVGDQLLERITFATRQLNSLIRHRRSIGKGNRINEDRADYDA